MTHERALVTGSSGFLGRYVAAALATRGFEVSGFDLLPAPPGGLTTTTIEGDICDLDAISTAVEGMDVVVHFGGVGDVDLATRRPELAAEANVVGTTKVAMATAAAGARLIYASTWEVYAPPITDPVTEEHPCAPAHIYAATKLAGEQVLRSFRESENVPMIVLRLGTAYGSGMRPNSVFRRFSDMARAGRPIVVHGTGSQWRQFTHASDIGRAVWLAAESGLDEATINITADECITIRHLAEIVASRYGVEVAFAAERHGDPPSARITSDKASSMIGWKAEIPFLDGLEQLLSEADQQRSSA